MKKYNLKTVDLYLILFSFFFIISFFFATTEFTQLSLDATLNSFGDYSKYTQRYYLSGVFKSVVEIDSYLKIFTTSFLGMFIFKILVLILTPTGLNSALDSFGLPITNEKFQILLIQLNETKLSYFLVALIICLFWSFLVVRFLNIQDSIKE